MFSISIIIFCSKFNFTLNFYHNFYFFTGDEATVKKSTELKKGSKIGKMQLSRSGKVILILNDGRKFEVDHLL